MEHAFGAQIEVGCDHGEASRAPPFLQVLGLREDFPDPLARHIEHAGNDEIFALPFRAHLLPPTPSSWDQCATVILQPTPNYRPPWRIAAGQGLAQGHGHLAAFGPARL